MLHLNQVQGEQKEEDSESGVEKKRKQVGTGEIGRPKQAQRNHGGAGVSLEVRKSDQTRTTDDESSPNGRIVPPQAGGFDESIRYAGQTCRYDQCPDPIDSPRRVDLAFRHSQKGKQNDRDGKRQINEEHPAP